MACTEVCSSTEKMICCCECEEFDECNCKCDRLDEVEFYEDCECYMEESLE